MIRSFQKRMLRNVYFQYIVPILLCQVPLNCIFYGILHDFTNRSLKVHAKVHRIPYTVVRYHSRRYALRFFPPEYQTSGLLSLTEEVLWILLSTIPIFWMTLPHIRTTTAPADNTVPRASPGTMAGSPQPWAFCCCASPQGQRWPGKPVLPSRRAIRPSPPPPPRKSPLAVHRSRPRSVFLPRRPRIPAPSSVRARC